MQVNIQNDGPVTIDIESPPQQQQQQKQVDIRFTCGDRPRCTYTTPVQLVR